jgi:hypothetical protein
MVSLKNQHDLDSSALAEFLDLDMFEPIRRGRGSAFPVRSQASRSRARKRSRTTAAGRLKARSFNGIHRRALARWS